MNRDRERAQSRRRHLTEILLILMAGVVLCLHRCSNSPWKAEWSGETLYTNYTRELKTLDPAVSFYEHEMAITDSIMEMPLGYDYLKRPYELVPMLAEAIPVPVYYDAEGRELAGDPPAEKVGRMELTINLKRGVLYQPHPCFAADGKGGNRNLPPDGEALHGIRALTDFVHTGTREMTAWDFKVALVRLCDRRLASPVYSNFNSFIAGIAECSEAIAEEVKRLAALPENAGRNTEHYPLPVDYLGINLKGIVVLDRYRFKLIMSRKYPQVMYWLAMHFFSPMPMEALSFYSDPRVVDVGGLMRNWPVGTGAYMMTVCRPREYIVLERNPNYREVRYPSKGARGDRQAGLLADAGKLLPLAERVIFNYERESLPQWIKFQQGYYDNNGIPTDLFEAAVTVDASGDLGLNDELSSRGIHIEKARQATSYYVGFNMLDKTVGGLTPEGRKLRQAISIALDFHEYVDIFSNDRDIAAQSIIPPKMGISGVSELNPFVDERDGRTGQLRRQSLEKAKKLLAEAGYPAGIGTDGKPLKLYFDQASAGQWKEQYQWMRDKLELLGIELESRAADLNRHREKIQSGNWQLMMRGWVADYPDPENFLNLFYGGYGVVANKGNGVNYTNYHSAEYDTVFKQLEAMVDGPRREELLKRAILILQEDAPCAWAFHRRDLHLVHKWLHNFKPHALGHTFLKYYRVDDVEREECRQEWNRPVRWPIWVLLGISFAGGLWLIWRRDDREYER